MYRQNYEHVGIFQELYRARLETIPSGFGKVREVRSLGCLKDGPF